MSKLKDTNTKGKQNRSMTKSEGTTDRARKEAAMQALAKLGYEKVTNGAVGELAEAGSYDKDSLVGVPFVIVSVEHKDSQERPGQTYVVVGFILPDSTTGFFADGGQGIKNQLMGIEISLEDPSTFVRVESGLRKSTYTNEFGPGATFYLAASSGKQKASPALKDYRQNSRANARA